jgi:hypothetical protein
MNRRKQGRTGGGVLRLDNALGLGWCLHCVSFPFLFVFDRPNWWLGPPALAGAPLTFTESRHTYCLHGIQHCTNSRPASPDFADHRSVNTQQRL